MHYLLSHRCHARDVILEILTVSEECGSPVTEDGFTDRVRARGCGQTGDGDDHGAGSDVRGARLPTAPSILCFDTVCPSADGSSVARGIYCFYLFLAG